MKHYNGNLAKQKWLNSEKVHCSGKAVYMTKANVLFALFCVLHWTIASKGREKNPSDSANYFTLPWSWLYSISHFKAKKIFLKNNSSG